MEVLHDRCFMPRIAMTLNFFYVQHRWYRIWCRSRQHISLTISIDDTEYGAGAVSTSLLLSAATVQSMVQEPSAHLSYSQHRYYRIWCKSRQYDISLTVSSDGTEYGARAVSKTSVLLSAAMVQNMVQEPSAHLSYCQQRWYRIWCRSRQHDISLSFRDSIRL